MIIRESVQFGRYQLTLETGRLARQASGAVFVTYGDSAVLVTAVRSKKPREVDFLPLTVDYIERTYAGGKIPGGFFKREGRLSDREVLISRIIDRPMRPLFPEGYRLETQIIATVLSSDRDDLTDVMAVIGASAALCISDIPFTTPVAGVKVGYQDGQFVLNPPESYYESQPQMEIFLACTPDSIAMVEGECNELSEATVGDALFFAKQQAAPVLEAMQRFIARAGKPKLAYTPPSIDPEIKTFVRERFAASLTEAYRLTAKQERYGRVDELTAEAAAASAEAFPDRAAEAARAFDDLRHTLVREMYTAEGRRIDGRAFDQVRPISCETGILPRVHGSGLFTRGETQAIASVTLGTSKDVKRVDTIIEEGEKRFYLHYNFPPFSVGEVRMLRGTSRREVGHGNLAERALNKMLPEPDAFPYTIRIVSEVLESNGSSSMATVCGGSLALMDAGVPVRKPVAGIAMGLVKEGERVAVLSDILGDEDHLGDMDFKVCGTADGVTSLQMDIKIPGITQELMAKALEQARAGRLHILSVMAETISAPRTEMSRWAPRIYTFYIKPERIKDVIGSGGKIIRGIVAETGCTIDLEDDGRVDVASNDAAAAEKAIEIIKRLTEEAEVGKVYQGTVRSITEFGAFIEIIPGLDGLLHISEIDHKRVEKVRDYYTEGDTVEVKVLEIDRNGKVRLSRKALLPRPEGSPEESDRPPRSGGPGRRDGGGHRDRGGRHGGGGRRD